MKSSKKARALATGGAIAGKLNAEISAARRRSETAGAEALKAKLSLKNARKAYKAAKKLAKDSRKKLKALKKVRAKTLRPKSKAKAAAPKEKARKIRKTPSGKTSGAATAARPPRPRLSPPGKKKAATPEAAAQLSSFTHDPIATVPVPDPLPQEMSQSDPPLTFPPQDSEDEGDPAPV